VKMVENPLEESLFPASLLPRSTSRNKVEELDSLLPAVEYPSLTVVPKPGLCVKTKNDKGVKFFVNICKLSEVPPPPPMEENELERMIADEDYSNLWRVPMSLGEPRKEKDKSGGECWAAEVAINSKWFEVMAASQVFLGFVITVAMEGLGDKYGESARLDRDSWVVLKNKKAMGDVLPAHRIQQRASTGIQAIESGDSVKPSQVKTDQGHLMKATSTSSKSNKNPSSSNPTIERGKVGGGKEEVEPKYLVREEPSLASLKRLRVEVDLPGVRSGKEVVVDVGEDRLVVCCPKHSYLLDIFLPHKLHSEAAISAFAKDEQKLLILIPVHT